MLRLLSWGLKFFIKLYKDAYLYKRSNKTQFHEFLVVKSLFLNAKDAKWEPKIPGSTICQCT